MATIGCLIATEECSDNFNSKIFVRKCNMSKDKQTSCSDSVCTDSLFLWKNSVFLAKCFTRLGSFRFTTGIFFTFFILSNAEPRTEEETESTIQVRCLIPRYGHIQPNCSTILWIKCPASVNNVLRIESHRIRFMCLTKVPKHRIICSHKVAAEFPKIEGRFVL